MGKFFAILDVLRKGNAVADPALWRNRGALTSALAILFMSAAAAAKGFGYDLGMDNDTAMALGGAVAFVVGLFTRTATSAEHGLPGLKPMAGQPGDAAAPPDQPGPAPAGGIDADTRAAAEMWVQRQAHGGGSDDLRGGP